MASIIANSIRIEYEEFGDQSDPTILLIMGLSAQLISWPEPFCEALVDRGYRVIRFDNRDAGLSQKFDGQRAPGPLQAWLWQKLGLASSIPYSLSDMANDCIGLLDALDIQRAHIVGASMGGIIAQIAAAQFQGRVASLTSMMSSSSNPKLPGPDPAVLNQLMHPNTGQREELIQHRMKFWRLAGSPAWPASDKEIRAKVVASMDRAWYPQGIVRQMAAIIATGNRVEQLKRITAPTLVIHGSADPLVPLAAGEDTARHISGARLEVIEGMGHDLPPALWPRIATLIADHADNVSSN